MTAISPLQLVIVGIILLTPTSDSGTTHGQTAEGAGTCSAEKRCDNSASESSSKYEEDKFVLYQHRAEKIGQVDTFDVGGQQYRMEALSLRPGVFEIDDFLSDEECDHIINLAKDTGLEQSVTYNNHATAQRVQLRDVNSDKILSPSEMILTIEDTYDIYLNDDDLFKMYEVLDLDKNGDTQISQEELFKIQPAQMESYLRKYVGENPHKHSRFSKQAWLYPDQSRDNVFINIQNRVKEITNLPMKLIKKSDFQVVKYTTMGHYNAHHDSTPIDKSVKCCSRPVKKPCRICRYMTVLFYLNDVKAGGGTAFIVAGNETLDSSKLRIEHKLNLQRYCDDAPLIVTPRRGKAILWYNHLVDEETGWVGNMDEHSWHGGCPVEHGEKWIANFWIKFTDNKSDVF